MIHNNHYFVMFVIMILAGALSTMSVWVDKLDDVRFSLNDVYMIRDGQNNVYSNNLKSKL
jgi:hypothetical protein